MYLSHLRIQLLFAACVCGLLLAVLKLNTAAVGVLLISSVGLTPLLFTLSSSLPYSGQVLTVKQINLNYSNDYIETHLSALSKEKWDILVLTRV